MAAVLYMSGFLFSWVIDGKIGWADNWAGDMKLCCCLSGILVCEAGATEDTTELAAMQSAFCGNDFSEFFWAALFFLKVIIFKGFAIIASPFCFFCVNSDGLRCCFLIQFALWLSPFAPRDARVFLHDFLPVAHYFLLNFIIKYTLFWCGMCCLFLIMCCLFLIMCGLFLINWILTFLLLIIPF